MRAPNDILGAVKKAIVLAWALVAAFRAQGAGVTVTVADAQGAPLEDAVVWLVGKETAGQKPRRGAAVEQVNKMFIPPVTVVQVGTQVRFPNRDEVRHHVYSFSPAKRFEIKLYAGTPAEPVTFDRAGDVVLGCNIHDHMIAYIYVVDSPYFAKTGKEGVARIEDVSPGEYELQSWHPAQGVAGSPSSRAALRLASADATASLTIALRPMTPRPALPK